MNQFIATAVAEKLAALTTAAYFTDKRAKADFGTFDALLAREHSEASRDDDRL
ncbi:hypothetical protein [Asticcacaulis sp. YBE204]|uniref:hypothetical protein n=1 Tax=Asticcacaulis sp. YBE204 TaxID=1282363 RepID=UPI0003C3FD28|nr:hypothetical protein [Asticcacaulis sp. YBE204]ESQ81000.1 hypothetical protein AEYBE204_01360 [Asticcacaulis sp. YBE204]